MKAMILGARPSMHLPLRMRAAMVLLLPLAVAFALVPFGAGAQAFADDAPAFAPSASLGLQAASGSLAPMAESPKACTTVDEVYAYLQEQMVARKSEVKFTLPRNAYKRDADRPTWLDESRLYAESDDPRLGDYLRLAVMSVDEDLSMSALVSFTYTFEYYTTAAQELQVEDDLEKVVEDLGLGKKSGDAEKVYSIYKWICGPRLVQYAKNDDLAYTAYGALYNKLAVCQGYATLFYRFARAAGLEVRCVAGWTNLADGAAVVKSIPDHMWNIVKVDGRWYNLDATWDSGKAHPAKYEWFLKNEEDFLVSTPGGTHTEFAYDYNASEPAADEKAAASFERVGSKAPTCTEAGNPVYYKCGSSYYDEDLASLGQAAPVSAARGHKWGDWVVDRAATVAAAGERHRDCTACGTRATEAIPATGGAGGSGAGDVSGGGSGSGSNAGSGAGDVPGGTSGSGSGTGAGSGSGAGTGSGSGAGTGAASGVHTPAVSKVPNTMLAKAKAGKFKVKYSKKKAVKLSAKKLMSVSNAQGKVNYSKAKGCTKKVSVASNGTVKIPKKTKRGTYTVKLNVIAEGDSGHYGAVTPVSFKIRVK